MDTITIKTLEQFLFLNNKIVTNKLSSLFCIEIFVTQYFFEQVTVLVIQILFRRMKF